MSTVNILIAGAGIAGLTAAIALQRKGVNVTVLEQASALTDVGAGIQLGPNATRPLMALGLADGLASIGSQPSQGGLRVGTSGHYIMRPDIALNTTGFPYYQLHRADLQALLLNKAQALGATIMLNAKLKHFSQCDKHIELVLENGKQLQASALIGADGVHSVVREQLFGDDKPVFTGNVAWRGLVPASKLPETIEAGIYVGAGRHFVTYPIRQGTLINFVAIEESETWSDESWTQKGSVDELRAAYKGWCKPVSDILANVNESFKWALYTRKPMKAWSKQHVCLIGDACHPTLPNLAAGAAMAIEDAYILAELIAARPTQLEASFNEFYRLRIKRCTAIQNSSRKMADFVHIRSPIEQWLKYTPAAIVARVWPQLAARKVNWTHRYDATSVVDGNGL